MPPLEWAGCMRQLNDELEERLKKKDFAAKVNRPRILVTGSPIIRVENGYNEEDVEQLRIRIEAFIELLKLKQFNEQKARQ